MLSAEEALQKVLERVVPLGVHVSPLTQSRGHALVCDLKAPRSLPPFDQAAMDGFAVASRETLNAGSCAPIRLRVHETTLAGNPPGGPLPPGSAVRIMTGAPLPEGADAVIPFEETESVGPFCLVFRRVSSGENVRRLGEDVRERETVVPAGIPLHPGHIALLAALGIPELSVVKKPRIAVVVTGSELVALGDPLEPGQIYDSNGPALAAALEEVDFAPAIVERVSDRREELEKRIREGLGYDVLITVGGVSVGDLDLVPGILESLGAKIIFHKAAIKPGKPILFAIWNGKPVFGLPGNPVSALMTFQRFVRPALEKMSGFRTEARTEFKALTEEPLHGAPRRDTYLRGIIRYEDGRYIARSAGSQGSASLLPLSRANAVLFIPASEPEIAAGTPVRFEPLWRPR